MFVPQLIAASLRFDKTVLHAVANVQFLLGYVVVFRLLNV